MSRLTSLPPELNRLETAPSAPPKRERLFCLWGIALRCNFRCSYCCFDSEWEFYNKQERSIRVADWQAFWDRIYALYGSAAIGVGGIGEPFLSRDFLEILRAGGSKHEFMVTTNMSWDVEKWSRFLNPETFRVSASFHPNFIRLDDIIAKINFLKKRGIDVVATIVAYPPLFERLHEYVDVFKANGIRCTLKPYSGTYGGKDYPLSYSPTEKEFLRGAGLSVAVPYQIWDIKTLGKMCTAGQNAIHVAFDGTIRRCANTTEPIGHVLDPDFELLKGPRPCPVDWCTCAAFAPCLVENEAQRLQDHRYTAPK